MSSTINSNYLHLEKWNPAEVSFFEILTLMIVISDIVTMNPKSQINGIVGIWDMKALSSSHFAQFVYPRRVLLFFKILQVCISILNVSEDRLL